MSRFHSHRSQACRKGGKSWFTDCSLIFFFLSLQSSPHKIKEVFIRSDAKKLSLFAMRKSICLGEKLSQQRLPAVLLSRYHGKGTSNNLVLLLCDQGLKAYTLTFIFGDTNLLATIIQLKFPFQPCLLMKKDTVKTRGFSCTCQYFKDHYISWHQCLGFLVSENCGDHL